MIDVSLTPGTSTYVMLNNLIAVFGDNISQDPSNVFTISGNVHINHVLFFDGDVTVTKDPLLDYPEISGSCGFYATIVGNDTNWIKHDSVHFEYYAQDNSLIPPDKKFYACESSILFGGFAVTIGEIIIDPVFDYVGTSFIVQMTWPLNILIDTILKANDVPFCIKKLSFSYLHSKKNGEIYAGEISGLTVNIGLVDIEDLNVYWNTNTETFGGGLTINIPASGKRPKSAFIDNTAGLIPVEILNENGKVVDSMLFYEFIQQYREKGFKLLSVGGQIEFVSGAINKIIVSVGTKVALGTTGLFITKMTGGFDDIATENLKIIANVDIDNGVEVPYLGSPVKIKDFGVVLQPWNTFRGEGEFQFFDPTMAGCFY